MSDRTIVNLLKNRTSQHPDHIAYTFLEDGENKSASLTYRQLDAKARASRCKIIQDSKSGVKCLHSEKDTRVSSRHNVIELQL